MCSAPERLEFVENMIHHLPSFRNEITPVQEAREMYERIPDPKEVIEYPGQHYEILSHHFPEIVTRSAEWLAATLRG